MPTFRTTDDVTLAYTDEGKGRPVVLVHGYTAPAASWALTVDALLAAGYRAIAFDRRAHGESETPPTASGWRATGATSASSWPTSTSTTRSSSAPRWAATPLGLRRPVRTGPPARRGHRRPDPQDAQ